MCSKPNRRFKSTGINESKTLTKHLSSECKCKKCNSEQWWNNHKCRCECLKYHICEKDYIWNTAACNCENGKYLWSIMVIQLLLVMKL